MVREALWEKRAILIIKARIYMYYPSNERDFSSLSIDVSNFENTFGGRNWYLKR